MNTAWQLLKRRISSWELNAAPAINTYDEEAQALRETGDTKQARRFSRLSQALAKPGQIRESAIQRFGVPISQALWSGWDEDEHLASAQGYYDEGRNDADFRDINELTPEQKEIMRRNMSKLVAQKKREDMYRQQAQGMEQELRDEDPTKFFADKERPFGPYEGDRYADEPNVRFGDVVMGEPMDIAFQLLKMPILPETFQQINEPEVARRYRQDRFTADFQHPHSKKIYPMRGAMNYLPKEGRKIPTTSHVNMGTRLGSGAVGNAQFGPAWDAEGPADPYHVQDSDDEIWTGGPNIPARGREDTDDTENPTGRMIYDENKPEASPVGMGSAMYDLAAMMGDRYGVKIVPSAVRSKQAKDMWRKNEERGFWPPPSSVQTGEPMDIAYQLLKSKMDSPPEDDEDDEGDDDFISSHQSRVWRRLIQQARDMGMGEEDIVDMLERRMAAHEDKENVGIHPGTSEEAFDAWDGETVHPPLNFPENESEPGLQRRVQDSMEGTFRGTPFNEDTGFTMGEPMDLVWRLLKMSADEADELEEQMLSDMERGISNPRTRRKQRSMGVRESKPTKYKPPGLHKRPMWEKKQKERDWERWGKREAEDRAVAGRDLPSYHGFGSDMDREIHPGDRGNDFSSMRGPKPGETGRYSLVYPGEYLGRIDRPLPFSGNSFDDLMESLAPGINESKNLRRFGTTDDSSDEPVWRPKPWTTSGPVNYVPETEEWINNIWDETPTFHGIPFNEDTGFTNGEPMDIALRLLKWESTKIPSMVTGTPKSPKLYSKKQPPTMYQRQRLEEMDYTGELADMSAQDAQKLIHSLRNEGRITGLEQLQENRTPKGKYIGATGREYVSGAHRADVEEENYDAPYPFGYWIPPEDPVNPNEDEPHDKAFNEWYGEGEEQYDPYLTDYWESSHQKGEPMDIALRLLKERKSPEAWANKKRYDTQYEKNPKRVKYREQLNAERRRRGIYGKGGKDVSHTQGGKLTLESAHSNRARHFKGKGTLRRVKVK